MLKIILKIASGYQIAAFVVLALVDINLIVLMIQYDLPLAWQQRAMTLLNLAVNLSLAKFYWDSSIILSSKVHTEKVRKKLKLWGLLSIFLCGLNQLFEVNNARTQIPVLSLEGIDAGLWLRIQFELYSWKPFINKLVYIISSTPNLFLICLLFLMVSEYSKNSEQVDY